MKINTQPFYIYGLYCPIEDKIKYIGKTTRSPHKRMLEHLQPKKLKSKTQKNKWLLGLLKQNIKPVLIVLLTEKDVPFSPSKAERKAIFWFDLWEDSLTNSFRCY